MSAGLGPSPNPMICPYCRAEIVPGESVPAFCGGCGTPHHKECYDENGGCTLFGCKEAPPDEPKVQVTNMDVVAAPPPWAGGGFPPPPGNFPAGVQMQATGFGDVNSTPSFGMPAAFLRPAMPSGAAPPPPPPGMPGVPPAPAGTFGYATPGGILSVPQYAPLPAERLGKSRTAFILLGIFLGCFGAHNLFAGFAKKGILQLCLTVGSIFALSYAGWLGMVVFGTWIWAIVDICTVDRDSNGMLFT